MGCCRQREREWGGGPARESEEPEFSLSCGVNSGWAAGAGAGGSFRPGDGGVCTASDLFHVRVNPGSFTDGSVCRSRDKRS